jgi:hypothetical protein
MEKQTLKNDADGPRDDRMITPERSVFGTQLPRPIGVGRHLIVVVLLSVLALVFAIVFAESKGADRQAPVVPPSDS